MLTKIGIIYRRLTSADFTILRFLVKNLNKFEYVPVEYIVKRYEKKITQKEIVARVKKLTKMKLLSRHPTTETYRITFLGLDCLALNILASKNIVSALGDRIGRGKESEIYKGLRENNELVVVKFYRIGRQSFRHVLKYRGYYENIDDTNWFRRSIIAGRREREILNTLNKYLVKGVPKIYGGALHSVVMEFIDGVMLYEVRELREPSKIFNQIIDVIKTVYKNVGVVHGDLSEYNIMIYFINDEENVYIIDWPQYVPKTNSAALQLLERDIKNIVRFFKKRFDLNVDIAKTFKYVLEDSYN